MCIIVSRSLIPSAPTSQIFPDHHPPTYQNVKKRLNLPNFISPPPPIPPPGHRPLHPLPPLPAGPRRPQAHTDSGPGAGGRPEEAVLLPCGVAQRLLGAGQPPGAFFLSMFYIRILCLSISIVGKVLGNHLVRFCFYVASEGAVQEYPEGCTNFLRCGTQEGLFLYRILVTATQQMYHFGGFLPCISSLILPYSPINPPPPPPDPPERVHPLPPPGPRALPPLVLEVPGVHPDGRELQDAEPDGDAGGLGCDECGLVFFFFCMCGWKVKVKAQQPL